MKRFECNACKEVKHKYAVYSIEIDSILVGQYCKECMAKKCHDIISSLGFAPDVYYMNEKLRRAQVEHYADKYLTEKFVKKDVYR